MKIDNKYESDNKKTLKEITNTCLATHSGDTTSVRICIIQEEFKQGFKLMKKYPKSVTIFGSARLSEDTEIFKKTASLAQKISAAGYAIVTGGSKGIMAAANKGAYIEGGDSIGINIKLPFEQKVNKYLTDSLEFHHFFSRKVTLSYSAEGYIYCPGGFGTLDEMFEILTLKQTGKIPDVPIILFGSEFWKPLEEFFKTVLLKKGIKTISEKDMNLYIITDSEDEIVDIITNTQTREELPIEHS